VPGGLRLLVLPLVVAGYGFRAEDFGVFAREECPDGREVGD
jgi:hypothetical protein